MQNKREAQNRIEDRTSIQAVKYALAAFGGFAADYLGLLLLKETAGLHYLIAVPLAFLIGIAVNYLIGIRFVFYRTNRKLRYELLLFFTISLLALGLTEGSMYVLTDLVRIDYRISRVISGVLTYVFNFCARKFLLYRRG